MKMVYLVIQSKMSNILLVDMLNQHVVESRVSNWKNWSLESFSAHTLFWGHSKCSLLFFEMSKIFDSGLTFVSRAFFLM
jgi:hypothetical protein